ncbi:VOC family protein [Aestuariibacter sp. AA17]|uniref:VOC family protein n=1 Tax=Fluctibacter corallii TaxID=2984329 RepID=A0ABT3ABE0_9ALTE|nr:VOC family protein [Aestuariibacter sp. AA17]MCV2885917.1 VOC family protein [Aestuariibacter sp. AA17]
MELGCFSVSLSVKDIKQSKAFYEALGFTAYAGSEDDHYLIMKNGDTNIGLFQGMFEGNLLTFNPGWNQAAQALDSFTDIRMLQETLSKHGIEPIQAINHDNDSGPANFSVQDPDGNIILFDQHI